MGNWLGQLIALIFGLSQAFFHSVNKSCRIIKTAVENSFKGYICYFWGAL